MKNLYISLFKLSYVQTEINTILNKICEKMSKREDGAKKNGVHKNYIYKFYGAEQAREGKIAERKKRKRV